MEHHRAMRGIGYISDQAQPPWPLPPNWSSHRYGDITWHFGPDGAGPCSHDVSTSVWSCEEEKRETDQDFSSKGQPTPPPTGTYSFLHLDAEQPCITGGVDPWAGKQLYLYQRNPHELWYSFHLPDLVNLLPQSELSINPRQITRFLNECYALSETFYQNIYKCPPRHQLQWALGQAFKFIPQVDHNLLILPEQLDPNDDEAWVQAFRDRFHTAVERRFHERSACMFSGGLDSSSIVASCLSKKTSPIHTFSWRFPHLPQSDEKAHQESMISWAGENITAHSIDISQCDPLANLESWVNAMKEPLWFPNMYLHEPVYRKASELGITRILDGMDGDVVVSHGLSLPAMHLKHGRCWMAHQSVSAIAQTFSYSLLQVYRKLIISPLLPSSFTRWRQALKGLPAARPTLMDFAQPNQHEEQHELSEHLLKSLSITESSMFSSAEVALLGKNQPDVTDHAQAIFSPVNSQIMEVQQRMAMEHGLDIAYPFFNLELVQLCLNMPARMSNHKGYTRWILRQSMQGLMPEALQWRHAKSSLGHHLHHQILHDQWQHVYRELHAMGDLLKPYLDIDRLLSYWRQCQKQPENYRLHIIWPALALAYWLKGRQ